MIDVFYYSIAGHKTNESINDLIEKFLDSEYIVTGKQIGRAHV